MSSTPVFVTYILLKNQFKPEDSSFYLSRCFENLLILRNTPRFCPREIHRNKQLYDGLRNFTLTHASSPSWLHSHTSRNTRNNIRAKRWQRASSSASSLSIGHRPVTRPNHQSRSHRRAHLLKPKYFSIFVQANNPPYADCLALR